ERGAPPVEYQRPALQAPGPGRDQAPAPRIEPGEPGQAGGEAGTRPARTEVPAPHPVSARGCHQAAPPVGVHTPGSPPPDRALEARPAAPGGTLRDREVIAVAGADDEHPSVVGAERPERARHAHQRPTTPGVPQPARPVPASGGQQIAAVIEVEANDLGLMAA